MRSVKIFLFFALAIVMFASCKKVTPVEPEEQFVQIYLKYGFKNELNTFNNTLQKDLIMDGVKTVEFRLTADEQNRILQKANEVKFFSLPDTFIYVRPDSLNYVVSPDPGNQMLRIKYQSMDKRAIWNYYAKDDPQYAGIWKLYNYIIDVIESKPEYKCLPPARGGYL